MPRFLRYLDHTIDAGLLFVLVFAPLAFGAVEEWARGIAQLAVLIVFAAWLLKLIWGPSEPETGQERGVILGGRVRLSGLELPGLLFAAVIALQLVPLPAGAIRAISPHTAEIFARSLPGYGESPSPSFAVLPRWLQADPQPEAGGVPALPPDPETAAAALPPAAFDVPHPAWRPLSLTPAHTARALVVFLAHLAVFVVVFNRLGPGPRRQRYLLALVGLAGLLSVLGILQELGSEGMLYWWRGGGPNHSFGPFVNANNFAGWMGMVLPLAAALAATFWERRQSGFDGFPGRAVPTGSPQAVVVLLGFVTMVGLAAFVLAKSRGGFLSLASAAGIVFLYGLVQGRLRWRAIVALLLVALLAVAMAAWIDWAGLWERYSTLGEVREEKSFETRLKFARDTVAMARDFPILGTGFGTFKEAFYLYTPGTSHRELARTHNDYAQLLAECGLLGGLAMIWALAVLLVKGVARGLRRSDVPSRWIVFGITIGVIALLIHSFVDFNLQIYSNGMLFVFLCAVLLRDGSEAARPAGEEPA